MKRDFLYTGLNRRIDERTSWIAGRGGHSNSLLWGNARLPLRNRAT